MSSKIENNTDLAATQSRVALTIETDENRETTQKSVFIQRKLK